MIELKDLKEVDGLYYVGHIVDVDGDGWVTKSELIYYINTMKQITKNTILKQGDKTYQPVEVDGIIYWVDEYVVCRTGELYLTSIQRRIIPKSEGVIQAGDKIIAQSQPKLEGIPVIDLKTNLNYYNINQYTQKDIEKAFECGRNFQLTGEGSLKETFEYINSISIIEVDSQFQILSYE
jgi:hypothetical protein